MSDPSRNEKKAFLRVLTSLAWADGVVDDDELQVLHLAASDLQVALGERDLEAHDLEALAEKIAHPLLRAKLLEELAKLSEVDDDVSAEELRTIKFFAERWELSPPHMANVDWDQVQARQ